MGKSRNRLRRRQREQREHQRGLIAFAANSSYPAPNEYADTIRSVELRAEPLNENATPLLRLVRPDSERIPIEPIPCGRASEAIDPVRSDVGSVGNGQTQAGADHVVAAVAEGEEEPVRVERSFDVAAINALFNDPSVFPLVSIPDIEAIDVNSIIADPRNVMLMSEGGGVLFCLHEPGAYEVHTAFIESYRGRHALKASLAAYRWMFTHTDCFTLLTKVPAINPAAENFCRLVGATREFARKAVWPTANGPVDLSFWSMRYDDWIRKTPSVKASGRAFHERLEQEFSRHGRQDEIHPDEECHDLHVGACAEMIYGGQIEKAIILYNRWASFAGYGPIGLVSREPVVIDIGNALLQITGDTFKVVLVK